MAILSNIQNSKIADLLPGIKSHHERWDGSGYPEGLRGETTPLLARIVGVADVFDAISSHRSYREALTLDESIELDSPAVGARLRPEDGQRPHHAARAGRAGAADDDGAAASLRNQDARSQDCGASGIEISPAMFGARLSVFCYLLCSIPSSSGCSQTPTGPSTACCSRGADRGRTRHPALVAIPPGVDDRPAAGAGHHAVRRLRRQHYVGRDVGLAVGEDVLCRSQRRLSRAAGGQPQHVLTRRSGSRCSTTACQASSR